MSTTDPTTTSQCPATPPGTHPTQGERLDYPFEHPTALAPPTEWARLRQECPVAHVRAANGVDGVLLTRYDDVKAMLADPRFQRGSLTGEPGGLGDTVSDDDASFGALDSMMEGEGHLRWRRLLGRTFTVKRVRAMQPEMDRIAGRLLDDMIAAGAPADLKAALGFPFPVFVICELLGVPPQDRDRFSAWSDRLLNLTTFTKQESMDAGVELYGYILGLVQEKREHPGADLLSELTTISDEDSSRLSEHELVMTGIALLVAGHETTANMAGKMVAMLLSERERWEQLLADRSLVRTAVEETLRFDANLGFAMSRHVDTDIEVAGQRIPAGTTVWSAMAAANRDESVFERADEMDLTRAPNPHLTFGTGAHSCLGQTLARVELQTVLTLLLDRLPTLELAVSEEELRRREGLLVGGLEEVPVRW